MASGMGKLTVIALVALAILFIYEFVVIAGRFDPVLTIFAVVALIIAVIVARGWRWGRCSGPLGSRWSS
jgi:hypothetical protein